MPDPTPPQYVCVPVEPTENMTLDGARSIGQTMGQPNHIQRAQSCYAAMLAASPNTHVACGIELLREAANALQDLGGTGPSIAAELRALLPK